MRPDADRFRILVVDDDPEFVQLVVRVLEEAGFGPPVIAENGREALRRAQDVDLVLLDHQLPDVNGLSLLSALRGMSGQPAVILVTAHGDEALAAGALRAGADDYLIKDPALASLLPEVIERARRNRALQEAHAAAERDLVHAERQAAIGQLKVTLSHNINNPLMAALAETEMLLTDHSLSPDQRTAIGSIKQALLRISAIIQQVDTLGHNQTIEYPGGLAMIDLSRRSQPAMVNAGEALMWLADESLARVVGSLLRHAGFSVERLADSAELARRSADPRVAVIVLLGNDAPGNDPLGGFRPPSKRRYTLVSLVSGDGARARAAGADHVVPLPFDPGTFTGDLFAAMR